MKTILMNSLVVSIFRYCSPFLINSNLNLTARLQTQLMKCTRYILGFESYKMLTIDVMNKLKFMTIYHMITNESILFIHKITYNPSPDAIHNLISYGYNDINVGKVRKPRVKEKCTSSKLRDSLLFRSIFLHNSLEYDLRNYNPKKLIKYLKENIQYIFPYHKILKEDNS